MLFTFKGRVEERMDRTIERIHREEEEETIDEY